MLTVVSTHDISRAHIEDQLARGPYTFGVATIRFMISIIEDADGCGHSIGHCNWERWWRHDYPSDDAYHFKATDLDVAGTVVL